MKANTPLAVFAALAALAALDLASSPASAANKFRVQFVSQDALKSICGKAKGDFLSGGKTYECTKPCGKGNCSVECDPVKKECSGRTPARTAPGESPFQVLSSGAGNVETSGQAPGEPPRAGLLDGGLLGGGPGAGGNGPAGTGAPSGAPAAPAAPPVILR